MQPSNYIPKGRLKVVRGSAALPVSAGLKYILQVVNDHGQYIGKVSADISKKWPTVGNNYKQWYRSCMGRMALGTIQTVQVQSDTIVVNMVAAHGTEENEDGAPPIRYDALKKCLDTVGKEIATNSGSVHMPRLGSQDETGCEWDKAELIVTEQLLKRGLNVTVYDS